MATIDSVKLPDNSTYDLTDNYSGYAKKVAGATTDDLASLTATGDLADSGKKLSDLVLKSDVKDVLNSTSTTDPLSANQGKVLADNLAANENVYGAKNQLVYPYKETSKSDAGITFTDNGNGTVTISGTASANIGFYCHKYSEQTQFLNNGSYILSAGASTSGVYVGAVKRESDGTYTYYDTIGGDVPITINGSYDSANGAYLEVSIQVLSGTVISTPVTFKPMIRDARIIDDTFVPYAQTNLQLTNDKAERADLATIHATGSTNTTGAQIDGGTFFYLNGTFCKALTNIAANATFTLNTNFKVDSVGEELNAINTILTAVDIPINDDSLTAGSSVVIGLAGIVPTKMLSAIYINNNTAYNDWLLSSYKIDGNGINLTLRNTHATETATIGGIIRVITKY